MTESTLSRVYFNRVEGLDAQKHEAEKVYESAKEALLCDEATPSLNDIEEQVAYWNTYLGQKLLDKVFLSAVVTDLCRELRPY